MTKQHHRKRGHAALTAAIALAVSATPWLAAAPAYADEDMLLRTWTSTKGFAGGTGLASSSCDFTGDGRDDIITSAWLWERAPFGDIGAVYVIPNGTASGELDDPGTGITRIEGPQINEISVGFRLNCAGDVNGDGFEDILIDEGDSSRVWVVFGNAQPETLSLEFLGDRGFAIDRAENIDAGVDTATAGVGDLDGDGFDDIAIVSTKANNAGGQVTVVRGRAGIATVHSERDEEVLMRINGITGQGLMRAERAGDVTGDGVADILVGAPNATTVPGSAKNTGSAWVVSGTSRGDIDLTGEIDGFRVEGSTAVKTRIGMSLAAAGDVDGDGFDDVLIGAPGASPTAGGVALVRGSASRDTVHTDPTAVQGHAVWSGEGEALADRGWWFNNLAEGSSTNFGFTVGAAPAGTGANGAGVGTLVLGDFIKSRTYALPTTVLGAQPVINVSELGEQDRVVYSLDRSYLGRSIGIITAFEGDACTQLAMGSDGAAGSGDVRLYSVPWSATGNCDSTEETAPENPNDTDDPDDTGAPATPATPPADLTPADSPVSTHHHSADQHHATEGSLAQTGGSTAGWGALAIAVITAGVLIASRTRKSTR